MGLPEGAWRVVGRGLREVLLEVVGEGLLALLSCAAFVVLLAGVRWVLGHHPVAVPLGIVAGAATLGYGTRGLWRGRFRTAAAAAAFVLGLLTTYVLAYCGCVG